MPAWKQILLSLVVLAAAGVVWIMYFPGANAVLARFGIDLPTVAAARTESGQPAARGRRSGVQPNVVTETVADATVNDRLSAIGTGRANNSVSVTPFTSGRLVEITAESGASINAGDAIARLDADAEQIAFDRARLALADANAKLERMQALRASNTATTVQVNDAELARQNAELALRDAQLALTRRTIAAPISGVVGILPVTEGNYVTASTVIATIDDRSSILVDFWVPEKFATMVAVGMPLTAASIARPDQVSNGVVSAIDNRVDEQSRTLHVQARIANPGDTLRAGMAFQVEMRFPGDTFPAVNPLAIQWNASGSYVWTIHDGKARRTQVEIIQRNADSVLVAGPIATGDTVVTEGVQSVREGAAIMIAENGGKPTEDQTGSPGQSAPAQGS